MINFLLHTGDVIPALVAQSAVPRSAALLPWEDVFVTGILAEEIGAKRVRQWGFTLYKRKRGASQNAFDLLTSFLQKKKINSRENEN